METLKKEILNSKTNGIFRFTVGLADEVEQTKYDFTCNPVKKTVETVKYSDNYLCYYIFEIKLQMSPLIEIYKSFGYETGTLYFAMHPIPRENFDKQPLREILDKNENIEVKDIKELENPEPIYLLRKTFTTDKDKEKAIEEITTPDYIFTTIYNYENELKKLKQETTKGIKGIFEVSRLKNTEIAILKQQPSKSLNINIPKIENEKRKRKVNEKHTQDREQDKKLISDYIEKNGNKPSRELENLIGNKLKGGHTYKYINGLKNEMKI